MARKHQGRKRRQPSSAVAGNGGGGFVATSGMGEMIMDGEVEMDDLAVAASYAALVYASPPVVSAEKTSISVDKNEISLMDDDDDGSQKANSDQAVDRENDNQQKNPRSDSPATVDGDSSSDSDDDSENEDDDENKSDDDDDDNDSELDIEEEHRKLEQILERKNQVDDTEDGRESLTAPKTENELDPYRTPLCELEKKFQLKLTVEENEKLRLCTAKTVVDNHQTNNDDNNSIKLCFAGKIKTHMVQDRTVIVESCGPAGDGSFTAPLDEGSLLVFEMDDQVDNPMTADTKSRANMSTGVVTISTSTRQTLIPLGKIFEVFGPVRRPLYAVRLPARETKTASKKSKTTKSLEVSTNNASAKTDDIGIANQESLQTENNAPSITAKNAESIGNESPSEDTKSKELSKEEALKSLDPEPSHKQLPQGTSEVSSIDPKRNTVPQPLDDKKEPGGDSEPAAKQPSQINDDMIDVKLEKINRKEAVVKEASTMDVSQFSDNTDCGAAKIGEGPISTKDTPSENSTQIHRVDSDPWSSQGKYTAFLDKHPELSIFYVQDSAKIIDAEAILRMSARGCDASNIYDEEVDNVNEMYFSDDEEERQLKSKSRNKNRGKEDSTKLEQDTSRNHYEPRHKQQRGGKSRSFQQAPPGPTGFHQHSQQLTQVDPRAYQTPPIYQAPHFYVAGAPPPPLPPPPPGGPSRGTYNHNHAPATAGGYMVSQPGYAQAQVYPHPFTHAPYGAYHQQPQQQHLYSHGYQQPYAHPNYAPQQQHQQQQQQQQHRAQQNQTPTQQQQSDTVYYDYS